MQVISDFLSGLTNPFSGSDGGLGDYTYVLFLWFLMILLVLELKDVFRSVPGVPLAPVYLSYRRAGASEKQYPSHNRPIRKISTRVGTDIILKDIPVFGSGKPFCFDIVYEEGKYWLYEKGAEPVEIPMNTQFKRGSYYFVLKEFLK